MYTIKYRHAREISVKGKYNGQYVLLARFPVGTVSLQDPCAK